MSTPDSAAAGPFIGYLQEVAAAERGRLTAFTGERTAAQGAIDDLLLRLEDARQALREIDQRCLVASERVSVVEEMIAKTAELLDEPAASPAGSPKAQVPDVPQENPEPPAASRTLKEITLAAFSGAEELTPTKVAPRVRVHRPQTTDKSVRATLSTLSQEGALDVLRHGVYRLPARKGRG